MVESAGGDDGEAAILPINVAGAAVDHDRLREIAAQFRYVDLPRADGRPSSH